MLQVDGLTVVNEKNSYKIVEGISFSIESGTTLGIVGESGCGKSVTGLSLLRLLNSPLKQVEGRVLFQGKNLSELPEKEFEGLRGNTLSMVFQNALGGLNPVMEVGRQVSEVFVEIEKCSHEEAKEKTITLFKRVRLQQPEDIFYKYPHQLSGGQKQRVMIAIAIAVNPKFLVADEPTTALDTKTQREILDLLRAIQEKDNLTMVYISHDIASVKNLCHRVLVMYNGKVVEEGTVKEVLETPYHPYTKGLLASLVRPENKGKPLQPIGGRVLSLEEKSKTEGCYFAPRCPLASETCEEFVANKQASKTHTFACNNVPI